METHSGLPGVLQEWNALNEDFSQLEFWQKTYSKAAMNVKKVGFECKLLIYNHLHGIARISDSIKRLNSSSEKQDNEISVLKKIITARVKGLKDMVSALPEDNSKYLDTVLGNVNVTLPNLEDKFKYKAEYERFKLAVTVVISILSFINIFSSYRALDAILHFVLVWYYCTLTIRESILVVNGSRIKGWWRLHHFIMMALAGVLVLWHDGASYQSFRKQFMCYTTYSSFLQFLQYYYQQGCLYRLRVLGERHKMDITLDGFHSWMWRSLKFLLPFLVIGYCWELFNVYTLFQVTMQSKMLVWQVPAAAIIFLILFSGNSLTTAIIVHQKLQSTNFVHSKLQ